MFVVIAVTTHDVPTDKVTAGLGVDPLDDGTDGLVRVVPQVLVERVHVGDCRYKPIARCTIADLDFCIAHRQNRIGQLQGRS